MRETPPRLESHGICRRFVAAVAPILLLACQYGPVGNINPEEFRAEYDAAARVVAPLHDLSDYEIIITDLPEVMDVCRGKYVACFFWGWSSPTIYTLPPPTNRCTPHPMVSDAGYGNVYAESMIHEFLHGSGFRKHSPEFKKALNDAWAIYRDEECS